MKKYILSIILSLATISCCQAQQTPAEITKRKGELARAKTDSARIQLLLAIGGSYRFSKVDSAISYVEKAAALARKTHFLVLEARALSDKGSIILDSGDIPQGYTYMLQSLNVISKAGDDSIALVAHGAVENRLGNLFMELGEYNTSIRHYRASISFYARSLHGAVYNGWSNIGNDYELMGNLDSAQYYQRKAYDHIKKDSANLYVVYSELEGRLGNIERDLGNYKRALTWYRNGAHNAFKQNDLRNLSVLYLNLGQLFDKLAQPDSALYYARKTLVVSGKVSMKKSEYQATELLSGLFKAKRQPDSALFYLSMAEKVKEELFGPKISRRLQQLALNEQQRQQQLQEQNDELKYRYAIIGTTAGLSVIVLIAIIIWRNYRKQKITSLLLSEQKEEIEAQRDNLERTLDDLKTTQNQLIQSEKMASLGELTAGIAHEIQNPLNFVNNFSELNAELVGEIKQEIEKGDLEEIMTIAIDIEENSKKINMHGKRAEGIVKGMLEHSRRTSGQKEPTDINQLADEYLRLSYHGLRAKDKSFNAELVTHFDAALPKISAIPQDIGRVLLNLFNNAFYAVNQKKKSLNSDYKPEVTVTTSTENNQVVIKVKDNGIGMPEQVKDKIMQPFFTTKPTGEGTGLGLSLTYDLVVKGHGGKIQVNSIEGEGSEFIIDIPV